MTIAMEEFLIFFKKLSLNDIQMIAKTKKITAVINNWNALGEENSPCSKAFIAGVKDIFEIFLRNPNLVPAAKSRIQELNIIINATIAAVALESVIEAAKKDTDIMASA